MKAREGAAAAFPARWIMARLVYGQSLDEMPAWFEGERDRIAPHEPPQIQEICEVIAALARLSRERTLDPPRRSRLVESLKIDEPTLDDIVKSVGDVLDRLAEGDSRETILRDNPLLDGDRFHAIVSYAFALAEQVELPRDPADDPALGQLPEVRDREIAVELLTWFNASGRITLTALLDRWRRTVAGVEGDYRGYTPDEFAHDLDQRDMLEDVLTLVSPESRGGLESVVRPLDERFGAATAWLRAPVRPSHVWRPQRWWWYRVPRAYSQEFERYFRDRGRLDELP